MYFSPMKAMKLHDYSFSGQLIYEFEINWRLTVSDTDFYQSVFNNPCAVFPVCAFFFPS